jgi:hypothetical protein
MNDCEVILLEKGSRISVKVSELKFDYRRGVKPGVLPCFPSLLAIPPVAIIMGMPVEERSMQIRQCFPIADTRLDEVVNRVALAGWPYRISGSSPT